MNLEWGRYEECEMAGYTVKITSVGERRAKLHLNAISEDIMAQKLVVTKEK